MTQVVFIGAAVGLFVGFYAGLVYHLRRGDDWIPSLQGGLLVALVGALTWPIFIPVVVYVEIRDQLRK